MANIFFSACALATYDKNPRQTINQKETEFGVCNWSYIYISAIIMNSNDDVNISMSIQLFIHHIST